MRGRKPKYGKSLRVLAETHGLTVSGLEYRMRLGIPLDKALKIPVTNQEISKATLEKYTHLTFKEVCDTLCIDSRKLIRLSNLYDLYFRRVSFTQEHESKVIVWCATHSPTLTYKGISKFLTEQLGFEVHTNSLRYRFSLFGFNLKNLKQDREGYQKRMLQQLWSSDNASITH